MPDERPLRLVVGYDGSPTAREALSVAARRAGPHGIVWVVHAVHPPPDRYDAPDKARWYAEHRDRAWSLLDGLLLVDKDEPGGPVLETELVEGPVAASILAVARKHDADEIIVGSRGLGSVRALLGSVSHALLMIADRPVLVIPAGARHGPSASPRDAAQTAGTRR